MSQELIDKVFSVDHRIRYAVVLNRMGRHLVGGMRAGVDTLNPVEEENKLFLQATISRGMSESWTKYFDQFRFTIIAHDKVRVFLFSFGNDVLLVTAEPSISLNVAEKISAILDKLG